MVKYKKSYIETIISLISGAKMIELKRLRKVYGSQSGTECVAINDIDLQLPDTGLIFIIGKSGSGKSTLLNLLGGLDTVTDGEIVADGNSLSSFTSEDFDNYRSSYIGFIFQHYYLIEELTIAQNIELAMNIVGKSDKAEVMELLEKVGLSGVENRYPRELSGGQQQRVAIARALAKGPKLILGDELTGNLDHKTSVDILGLLKEISRERLVVVVSHNLDEADMFADRIIELHDGKISRDRIRVKSEQKKFLIKEGTAYLPYFRDLKEDELRLLELGLKNGEISDIVQLDDGFAQTLQNVNSDRQIALENKEFFKKAKRKYAGIYVKKGLVTKLATVIIVTLMLLCASVFSTMHKIRYSDVKYDSTQAFVPLNKVSLEASEAALFNSYLYAVTEEDHSIARETLGGEVYELTNVTLLTTQTASNNTGALHQFDMNKNVNEFYLRETYGTLICDVDFLIGEYGVNGELILLAGDISTDGTKLTVTDYVADSLIYFSNGKYGTYEEIIEGESKIGAVIATGYKERYASIISRYSRSMTDEGLNALYKEISDTELHRSFRSEILYTLGITYSFNPCFKADYRSEYMKGKFTARRMTIAKDGAEYPSDTTESFVITPDYFPEESYGSSGYIYLEKGEIEIPYGTYNNLFGTSYSALNYDTFTPHDVTVRIYDRPQSEDRILLFEKTYTVVGLRASAIEMHEEDFLELRDYSVTTFGLYLENNENLEQTVAALADREMAPKTIASASITGINKIMAVFIPLLKLIGGGLYAFIIIYLINYSGSNVKSNYFRIGVMRSFGAKSADVGVIFITGVVLTGAAIVILNLLLEPVMVGLYNRLLVESFSVILNTYAYDITVVDRSMLTSVFNSLLIIAITSISAWLSLATLKKLKPIEIIRVKENGGEIS